MSKSTIEWTDETWNVTTGCTRVSAGCDNCYAVEMTKRLASIEATKEKYGGLVNEGKDHFNGVVKLHEDELEKPLKWRKPRRVFVNSMSDLFHPEVPFEFIDRVFAVMALSPKHTFQVLTKRPDRMCEYLNSDYISRRISSQCIVFRGQVLSTDCPEDFDYLDNVWVGTSLESQDQDWRVRELLKCPAAVRFISCEPLLGEVDLTWIHYKGISDDPDVNYFNSLDANIFDEEYDSWLDDESPFDRGIDWVIAGGESGHNARPMHPDWVRSLRDQCKDSGVSFFFKQWGEWQPGSNNGKNEKLILKDGTVYRYPAPRELVMTCYSESEWNDQNPNVISKVGKKRAGRLLDGREWNEMPGGVSNDS